MKVEELRALCADDTPCPGTGIVPTHLYLTLQRDHLPRGERVSLFGGGKPLGRVCTVKEADDTAAKRYLVVAVFNRRDILKRLERSGA